MRKQRRMDKHCTTVEIECPLSHQRMHNYVIENMGKSFCLQRCLNRVEYVCLCIIYIIYMYVLIFVMTKVNSDWFLNLMERFVLSNQFSAGIVLNYKLIHLSNSLCTLKGCIAIVCMLNIYRDICNKNYCR